MDERPEEIKQSAQGKKAAAIQKQSGDYLKPLFKSLRSRVGSLAFLFYMFSTVHPFL